MPSAPESSGITNKPYGKIRYTFCQHTLKTHNMEKMNTPDTMTTSSEILNKLRAKHMDNEFRWTPKGFTTNNGKTYRPEDLEIVRTVRFEGMSNPSDMEILYILRTNDGLIG